MCNKFGLSLIYKNNKIENKKIKKLKHESASIATKVIYNLFQVHENYIFISKEKHKKTYLWFKHHNNCG